MSAKRLSLLALFIALSVIGALIKIPALVGSIALDVFPALLASVLIGKRTGAIVAVFGHLISSLIVGMPLGPFHVIVAIEMAVIVWVFTVIYQFNKKKLAGFFFIVSNTLLAPLPMLFIFGLGFYIALLLPLFIGSFVNVLIALLLIPRFKIVFHKNIEKFN